MVQLTGKRWPLVGKRLVADMPFIETEVGKTNLAFRDLQFQPNVFVQPSNSFDYVKSMVAKTRHRSKIDPGKKQWQIYFYELEFHSSNPASFSISILNRNFMV